MKKLLLLLLLPFNSCGENKLVTLDNFSFPVIENKASEVVDDLIVTGPISSHKINFDYSVLYNTILDSLHYAHTSCVDVIYFFRNDWFDKVVRFKDDSGGVIQYVNELCTNIIIESVLNPIDMMLVLSVIQRESNFGRLYYKNGWNISMDVCHDTVHKDLIKAGPEWSRYGSWIFRNNRYQFPIIIESISNDIANINRCVAGEAGIFQLIPSDYRRDRIVPRSDFAFNGNLQQRRTMVNTNLEVSVKIGIEELIRHRNINNISNGRWWRWIGTYNTGQIHRGRQWGIYSRKICRNYQKICKLPIVWHGCNNINRAVNYLFLTGDDDDI